MVITRWQDKFSYDKTMDPITGPHCTNLPSRRNTVIQRGDERRELRGSVVAALKERFELKWGGSGFAFCFLQAGREEGNTVLADF